MSVKHLVLQKSLASYKAKVDHPDDKRESGVHQSHNRAFTYIITYQKHLRSHLPNYAERGIRIE